MCGHVCVCEREREHALMCPSDRERMRESARMSVSEVGSVASVIESVC